MKKISTSLFVIMAVAFLAACASTKSAKENSPAGEWEYSIQGTPEGDFSGIMTITKTENGYTGQLGTSQGTLPFPTT